MPAVLVSQPVLSGTVAVGQTLSVTQGSWTSVEPWYVSYQWQRCTLAESCSDIPDHNGPTYKIDGSDAGYTIQVIVTAEAGWAASSPDAQTPVTVVAGLVPAQPPSPAVQPTVRGTAVANGTVTVQPDPWYGTQPITLSYQWLRCKSTNCAPITSATGPSYALGLSDTGTSLEVVVTATNTGGSASSTSAAVSVQEPLSAPAPTVSASGTVTAPSVPSLAKLVRTYQWQFLTPTRAWTDIDGKGKPTLQLAASHRKETVRVLIVGKRSGGCTTTCVVQTAISKPVGISPARQP